MIKEFRDDEFKLYGSVQSFFYRCWIMFGYGRVSVGGRQNLINRDLVTKWAGDLFPTGRPNGGFSVESWNVVYPNDNPNVIELIVRPSRVSNWEVFTVDISQNLEDYDFYNIKWVHNIGQVGESLGERPIHTYKAVPKVF
jgi:hypothetical protein